VFAALLIPIAWLKTMNEVSVLAVFGVLASLFVAGVVIIKGFERAATTGVTVQYDTFRPEGISNAINIIVFSFGGHSVLPNIISHVQRPKANYAKVSSWAYFFIAVIYLLTAAGGYAGWGKDTATKVLENMDEGSSVVVEMAYAAITAHVVLAYPIPLNPLSLAIERSLRIDERVGLAELIPRIISRTCLVLLTVLVASVVPFFGDILSLVSALSVVVVAFVLPPLFYYKLRPHHPHKPFSRREGATMIFIVLFGVASSAIGIYYAIHDLIDDIRNSPNPFDDYF
jgi:amino acid permease